MNPTVFLLFLATAAPTRLPTEGIDFLILNHEEEFTSTTPNPGQGTIPEPAVEPPIYTRRKCTLESERFSDTSCDLSQSSRDSRSQSNDITTTAGPERSELSSCTDEGCENTYDGISNGESENLQPNDRQ
jgi:hypothetical protein